MSSFPAVATVIGVSQEVAESGPLLATLAIDPSLMATQAPSSEPLEIKAGDPVTQAVVDNIIGKLPSKKEPVMLKCDVCNITVSSEEVLQTHYAGAKHAKKLKGQELIREITNSPNSTFVATTALNGAGSKASEFTCKICNVKVNSYQQLQQHLTGSKHKNKIETNKSNTMQMPNPDGKDEDKGVVKVDIKSNRLYCAACNVHVNSDLQLHQHITSSKHANKVNGRSVPAKNNNRGSPYTRRPSRNWEGEGNWNNGWTGAQANNRNKTASPGWSPSSPGWSPSNSNLGLTGNNWHTHTVAPSKPFVSGEILYNR